MKLPRPYPDQTYATHLLTFLSPAQCAVVEARRRACTPCSQNQELGVVSVRCRACGCAGVSLIHGRCKLRKWPPGIAPGTDGDGKQVTMPAPPREPERPAWQREPATPHSDNRTPANTRTNNAPTTDLFIYGFPGLYAGANTELHHQVLLWRKMGLAVHLIPGDTRYRDEPLYPEMIKLGLTVHKANDFAQILPGAPVFGFCNGRFLEKLDAIMKRSHNTVFVNCMTWLFKDEQLRQRQGKLAAFVYQNEGVMQQNAALLREINPDPAIQYLAVLPYFDASLFPYIDPAQRERQRQGDTFTIGRISRNDADKYSADTLAIWEAVHAPGKKRGLMLGFGKASEEKIGHPPLWVDLYADQNQLSPQEFYARADVIVQPMDTTENWPRVGLEAMASGSVLIVDDRGGWQPMIEHGVTGWLCKTPDDFVKCATRMAHEPEERAAIATAARKRLDELAGFEVAANSWGAVLERLGVAVPTKSPNAAVNDAASAGRHA